MHHYGEATIAGAEKDEGRALALRPPPYTEAEKVALLNYNASDVDATARLFRHIVADPRFSLGHALWRAETMAATMEMEWTGVPVDRQRVAAFEACRMACLIAVTSGADPNHEIFTPTGGFVYQMLEDWIARREITDWPRTRTGLLSIEEKKLDEVAAKYPEARPLVDALWFKHAIETTSAPLALGPDDRARGSWKQSESGLSEYRSALLSPFGALTSRNRFTPTTYALIRPNWFRTLAVRPRLGEAIALIDYTAQEFAVSGALSHDQTLMADYAIGDVHMQFAILAGLAPRGATKKTHGLERAAAKAACLAVFYGVGAAKLAAMIGKSVSFAQAVLANHRSRYSTYWRWSDGLLRQAYLVGEVSTLYGWRMRVTKDTKPNTIRNFFVQGNASEMTRMAVCDAIKAGVQIAGPAHDSIVVIAPEGEIEQRVKVAQDAMEKASREVLDGFTVRTEVQIVRHGGELVDARGDFIRERIDPIIERWISNATRFSEAS
jgi:hypothetical protein